MAKRDKNKIGSKMIIKILILKKNSKINVSMKLKINKSV